MAYRLNYVDISVKDGYNGGIGYWIREFDVY
jgi:hypothetical protein